MIGVDTNVLVRLYVADDARQHAAAVDFFAQRSERSPAYVSLVVLIEFVWALAKTYKYGWDQIYGLVGALTAVRDVLIEREDVVSAALEQSIETNVGFVDAIIARANAEDGCSHTITFDKKTAQRISSMELLQ